MNICFRFVDTEAIWVKPLAEPWFAEILCNHGINVVKCAESAHLVICDSRLEPGPEPTVVFCWRDAAEVPADCGKWDDRDNVLGYILPIRAPGGGSLTARNWGIFHTEKPVTFLTTMLWNQLPKIMGAVTQLPRKTWDVSFAGTVGYAKEATRRHRAGLMHHWADLQDLRSMGAFYGGPGASRGSLVRLMSLVQHYRLCASSRVVVSPWGVCEVSWRDYEAAIGAAVIVKPRGTEVRVDASPWHATTYSVVYCEPDYSDLRKAVDESLIIERECDMSLGRDYLLRLGRDGNQLAEALKGSLEILGVR